MWASILEENITWLVLPSYVMGNTDIGIAVLTSDIDITILSVCLSVCPSRSELYRNGLTYRHTLFSLW